MIILVKTVVGIDQLEIGDTWARIPYGSALDLGGCGKGYLADLLRAKLPDSVTGYWLSLGGDIAIGGQNDNRQPWFVTIQAADDQNRDIGGITVTSPSGVATSGTTVHKGKKNGKSWHHIIDPRTLQPAKTDVFLATVHDNSSLRADVLASCAIILGCNQGLEFLKNKGVKAAVLQCQAKSGGSRIVSLGSNITLGAVHA